MSASPPENAAPCGSSSELDFPGTSMSVASPFGTYKQKEEKIIALAANMAGV